MHDGGQSLRVTTGIGHDQGDGTAGRSIRRTGNGRSRVVGVVRRIHTDGRLSHIDTAIVGCLAGVTRYIGHTGVHLVATFCQRRGHIHAVTAIRLHSGGKRLLTALGIGDQDSNDTARCSIRLASNGRGGVIGIVRRIDADGRSCHIYTTVLICSACIPRRIGDAGRDGIRALSQGRDNIDSESAVWIDYRGKGLLITIRIGDQKGHDTASRSISGTGQSWGGVIGVIRSRYSDHRRHKVDQLIVGPRQGIGDNTGIDGIGRIKPRLGDGGIPYSVDGDKAAVAAGASNTTDAATASGRCATRGRGFKSLGRVSAAQNGLLQCIDIVRSAGCTVLCQLGSFSLFGRLARLTGRLHIERLVAAHKAATIGRDNHSPFWQYIPFNQQLPAAVCGKQVNLSFELGYGYALFQGNGIGSHVLS